MEKTLHLENLVLFNKQVQKSGGVMDIVSSYTDDYGNVFVRVTYNSLTTEGELLYEKHRIKKILPPLE